MNALLGVWIVLSPFVLGFSGAPAALWNNVTIGVALTAVALAGGWADGGILGISVPLSIWLFVWPFVLGFWGTPLLWNSVILTFLILLSAAINEGVRAARVYRRIA